MQETEDTFIDDFLSTPYVPRSKPKRAGKTPHAKLKKKARQELGRFARHYGLDYELIPYTVAKVWFGEGKNKREGHVGKSGTSDDLVGIMGCCLAAEYKTGNDTLKPNQERFRDRWVATGNHHAEIREPSDMWDALIGVALARGITLTPALTPAAELQK